MLRELNQVINYIEKHLSDDNFTMENISEYANVSEYHFKQIFFYLTGMTINEYIRYRKLSSASMDLLNKEKVTEVAFKYGYKSMDGFTRAFKKWSGILPSEVSKNGISQSFPKFSFAITIKGGIHMNFRIEQKPEFNIVGVSKRVPMQYNGINNEIVKLAKSITEEQKKEMHKLQNIEPFEIINASYDSDSDFKKEEGFLTHMIGVLTTENNIKNCLEILKIPSYTWAIFPNEGEFPSTLQTTMARIYSEWIPSSYYELIKAPTFSFTKMHPDKHNFAYSEIWIPVKKLRN